MKRLPAAILIAWSLSALPAFVYAQSVTWTDGAYDNTATVDSGELHYRRSKPLDREKTAWWEYKVSLNDIDCLQFRRLATGDILSVIGKHSDVVIKVADLDGSDMHYETALRTLEIDFPPAASAIAANLVSQITGSRPGLAARTNKGDCIY
jgi:hypothetical protein